MSGNAFCSFRLLANCVNHVNTDASGVVNWSVSTVVAKEWRLRMHAIMNQGSSVSGDAIADGEFATAVVDRMTSIDEC